MKWQEVAYSGVGWASTASSSAPGAPGLVAAISHDNRRASSWSLLG